VATCQNLFTFEKRHGKKCINSQLLRLCDEVHPIKCRAKDGGMLASCSHLPFQRGRACVFSYAPIGFDALQLLVLCMPLILGSPLAAAAHAWWVGGVQLLDCWH
jgi:hypothetical protein